ncbi:MAG: hypothetical protein MUO43_17815 [Desulfobacterales bacterium]|nr:hypothetical protein [Desulfobacterales bacterium]
MKERLLNIAENRLLVVFLVIIMLTVSQFAYAGDPVPTCASCGAVNPKAASDHNPGCPYGPKSSTGSSSGGFSVPSGTNPAQAMALGIIGGFLNEALSPPPDNSYQEEQVRQQEEQKRQAAEQARQAAIQAWIDHQNKEDLQRKIEQEAKIERGKKVLSQMQKVGGSGELKPFSFGNPKLDLKPIGQTYPAPSTAWEQALCAAYFSNLAKRSTKDVDARFYADQAQRVMVGEPTYLECRIPQISNEKLAKRMKEVKQVYEEMNVKMNDLQDIEAKLTETREKIKDAEIKKEDATVKLNELQTRAATASPEEKAEVDDLVRQAQEQEQIADQQLNQAKESEKDALNKKEQLENELGNMKSQMQAKMQAGGE